jgi:hypothetical protein
MCPAQVLSALKDAQMAGYIKAMAKPPAEFVTPTKEEKEERRSGAKSGV